MYTAALWIGFNLFILAMLALDLYLHKKEETISQKQALKWSFFWIVLAMIFCVGIYFTMGSESALNFLTGYIIEKMLSFDNLFIFLAIFSYFSVPDNYRHKILFWGVLSALVLRALFIFLGIVLIQQFFWITYIFGALLIYSGIKIGLGLNEETDPTKNPVVKFFRKFFSVTNYYVGDRFFVYRKGRVWATPLFVVLIAIETTDIIFAVDSVPAVLAITTDPFIVYTSNVFAILGLRALYFALTTFMQLFHFLDYALAAILVFVGVKMLLAHVVEIPIGVSLGVIIAILAIAISASLLQKQQ